MVSIIIVTYNSAKYIERLLESIFKFNKDKAFEVIVVDNNSTDGTLEIIQNSKVKSQNLKSKVKIIENKENFGFAKGINIGAKEARGEYLLFINPDCEWNKGSLDNLVSIFEEDVNVGVAGGKILNRNLKSEKSAGKFLKTSEVFLTALGLDETFGIRFSPGRNQQVDFVSGGFMAVRRDLFARFNGFDENLFMYIEDMEFCYRVKKEGLEVVFDPSIEVIHEGYASSSRGFAIRNIHKGLIYFQQKHGNPFSYSFVKFLLFSKSFALVVLGKIINNKYLTDTYKRMLKV